jgi:GT2 family glycosyltransferase
VTDAARHDKVDCAIVIVTYNSAGYITRLLDSLTAAAAGLTLRVVVVDNGSVDGTAALVRMHSEVCLVEANANLGYAGGINLGRGQAGDFETLAVLNPDLVLEPGAIRDMFAALADPAVGVVVPRLLNSDGSHYPSLRREPSLVRAIGDALFGDRLGRRPGWLSECVRTRVAYERQHPVDWAGGAALMISAGCDRAVGAWDERFFLYMEEVDFCARVRQTGLRIDYVPTAKVWHRGGGSGHSAALTALNAVNRVRYYEKHHTRVASVVFRGIVICHCLVRAGNPGQRSALRTLLRRVTWRDLPHADATFTERVGA